MLKALESSMYSFIVTLTGIVGKLRSYMAIRINKVSTKAIRYRFPNFLFFYNKFLIFRRIFN